MQATIHFWVSGRVQGVRFRASTQEHALLLGLTGWVRNLDDGRVEGMASGHPKAVDQLVAWLHQGPSHAQVESLNIEPAENPDLSTFEIRYEEITRRSSQK